MKYPSLKAPKLLRILEHIGYETVRQKGSHRVLRAPGRQQIIFAFHDNATIAPGMVRKILERDAGLTPQQAAGILKS